MTGFKRATATLVFALATQTASAAAQAPGSSPAAAGPAARLARMQAKLIAMGFPPGAEMPADQSEPIGEVTLAPLFHKPFFCSQHPQGSLSGLGDALGSDCVVVGGVEGDTGFMSPYRTDGRSNADWYGWRAEVHAPFDGVVAAVIQNPVTNTPGRMGKPPGAGVIFTRGDGVNVTYAHLMDVRVRPGDRVTAGQVVALDGDNGMARNPHVHVGAWRGKKALQIRWNLAAMGAVPALADN